MKNFQKLRFMTAEEIAGLMVRLVIRTEFILPTDEYYSYWTFNDFDGHEVVQCSSEEEAVKACIEWLNKESEENIHEQKI